MAASSQWFLLIEDQQDDIFFFQTATKKAGVAAHLEVAADGRQAIDRLTRCAATPGAGTLPSLVVLDLKLPYVSGLEVLAWIREQAALCSIPVVILSSSEQDDDIRNAYRLGAFGYLTKPSQPGELVALVRALDEFWLRRNRLLPAETPVRRSAPVAATN